MPRRELPVHAPFDLARTLAPLVRGAGDQTIRLRPGHAVWATRGPCGPATVDIRHEGDRLHAEAFGPGAEALLERLDAVLGIGPGAPSTDQLRDAPDRLIRDLARRLPGIRIPRTGAVVEALIPAILEQKVTGTEARRAWGGLVGVHGDDAPGPIPGLRVSPAPAVLARMPYHAFHPFGVEARRARLIAAVAARAAWFDAAATLPLAAAHERLTSVAGIGPWTAAEVAVRALGDADAVSIGDFHLPHLVAWALAGEPRADDARMVDLLAPYAGRRALVVRLLESSGLRAPRYGPRLAPRRIEAI